jgi:nicotinate-nucleotide pyrophosphorylase (carboxylating)
MSNYINLHKDHFDFKKFVKDAFAEDIGDGDHTSLATIPSTYTGHAQLLVKEKGIIAGIEAARLIFHEFDPSIKFTQKIHEGTMVEKGDVAFVVKGSSRNILTCERLVLNVMQRMSAIATHTNKLMELCKGTKAKVIDTRKTTPGFRFFEKWAVVLGGGANHRFGLYDMILIKDNHIDFAGGIAKAIDSSRDYLKETKKDLKIEIEVRNLEDIEEVLSHGGVDRILIDNFSPSETKKAIKLINGKVETESSGGINEENIRDYALCGVDYISIGALTHHVKSMDLSLKAIN